MDKVQRKKGMVTGMWMMFSVLFTCVVKMVDVAPAGPEGVQVGCSHINERIFQLLGVHKIWYDITEVLGIVAILVMALFAGWGILQWIQRKSLTKVDRALWLLGGLYAVLIVLYVFFEIFVVNERPILMPGQTEPEASFPSSHTMLAITVFASGFLTLKHLVPNKRRVAWLRIPVVLLILLTVGGRLYSGVHWFTDIVAGTLYSLTLVSAYQMLLTKISHVKSSL